MSTWQVSVRDCRQFWSLSWFVTKGGFELKLFPKLIFQNSLHRMFAAVFSTHIHNRRVDFYGIWVSIGRYLFSP